MIQEIHKHVLSTAGNKNSRNLSSEISTDDETEQKLAYKILVAEQAIAHTTACNTRTAEQPNSAFPLSMKVYSHVNCNDG
jgi:hypothetical protein